MTPVVAIPASFDLAQTLDCGQAFRWRPVNEDSPSFWEGVAFDRYLRLERQKDVLLLYCSQEEFQNFWRSYFDLDEDYEAMRSELSALCPALKSACDYAPGIRLLRQNPWEALCSFLISQNNHIPRIKGILQRLCQQFGSPIAHTGWHAFPTAAALASARLEDLAPIRAGFRAKYLLDAAKKVACGEVDLDKIFLSSVEYGREELQKILGVGPKVAECTLLYGFHKTTCFPMDVWMKRAMAVLLPGRSPLEFGTKAGLAQQYLFHYSRMHPELFSGKSA